MALFSFYRPPWGSRSWSVAETINLCEQRTLRALRGAAKAACDFVFGCSFLWTFQPVGGRVELWYNRFQVVVVNNMETKKRCR